MATKKTPTAKSVKPVPIVTHGAVEPKPLTPFKSTDPRLVAARQDANLVAAAGIVNGMDQDTIDARLIAVLGA